eukprot:scaffold53873_cov37-Phaeocystis_antarctica.AAC.2
MLSPSRTCSCTFQELTRSATAPAVAAAVAALAAPVAAAVAAVTRIGRWSEWASHRTFSLMAAMRRASAAVRTAASSGEVSAARRACRSEGGSEPLWPRYATLRDATRRYATLRHATRRYATLRHATPRVWSATVVNLSEGRTIGPLWRGSGPGLWQPPHGTWVGSVSRLVPPSLNQLLRTSSSARRVARSSAATSDAPRATDARRHGEARLEGGKRRQSPHGSEALAGGGLAHHGLAQPEALRVEVGGRRSNALHVAQHEALSLCQQRILGALQVGIEDGKRRDSVREAGEAGGSQWCGSGPTAAAAASASARAHRNQGGGENAQIPLQTRGPNCISYRRTHHRLTARLMF